MTKEHIFDLAVDHGVCDDFGRWNFTDEGLLDFVLVVQKREWVGLTDNEYATIFRQSENLVDFCRVIETKLRERNNG